MSCKALLQTVGTGTADQEEETLFTPFRKSIEQGEFHLVLLLPSRATEANARAIAERQKDRIAVEVAPLAQAGDEENADKCFEHFTRAIDSLQQRGFAPKNLIADYTRGTKAMSAALALAAVSQSVGTLRYMGATKRLANGMAAPGCEVVSDIRPEAIFRHRDLRAGLEFLRHGDFAAVAHLFPDGERVRCPGSWANDFRWLRWCADFWGAWDRFHHRTAKKKLTEPLPEAQPSWVAEFQPRDEQKKLLHTLAEAEPRRRERHQRAACCRALAADLTANAWRRFAQGQYEEVLVRLYRLLELTSQERLFARGYDAEYLDPKDPDIGAWIKKKRLAIQPDENGRFKIGREKSAELLQHLGDPIAERLLDTAWLGEFNPIARNRSVLVHGFRSRTEEKKDAIEEALKAMEQFLLREFQEFDQLLDAARFHFLKV